MMQSQSSSLLGANLRSKVVCGKYILNEIIGNGSFGNVYNAVHYQNDNDMVAVKVISRSLFVDNQCEYLVDNEIEALRRLQSPNILKYIDHQITKHNYYIVMELCSKETLFARLGHEVRFPEKLAYEYFGQILNGIKEMHLKGVVHRDLKLENIIFQHEQLKIMDFGFSTLYDPKYLKDQLSQTALGSGLYMAPEVLAKSPYIAIKADMYSLGVILYMMLFGKYPYAAQGPIDLECQEQINLIKSENMILDHPGVNVSQATKDLLKGMLKFDPSARTTYSELYDHPNIKNLGTADTYKDKGSIGLVINIYESKTMYKGLEQKFIHPEKFQKLESNSDQNQQNPGLQHSMQVVNDDGLKTVDLKVPLGAIKREASNIIKERQASMIQYSSRQLYEKNQKFYLGYMHQAITLKPEVGTVINKEYCMGLLLTKMYRECIAILTGLKEKQNVFQVNNWELIDGQYHTQLINHFEDYLTTLQVNVHFLIPDYKKISQQKGQTNQLVQYLGNTQVGVEEFEKVFQDSFKTYYKEIKEHISDNEDSSDLQHLYLTLFYIMDIYNTEMVYRNTGNEEFQFEEFSNQISQICNQQEWKDELFTKISQHPNKESLEKD